MEAMDGAEVGRKIEVGQMIRGMGGRTGVLSGRTGILGGALTGSESLAVAGAQSLAVAGSQSLAVARAVPKTHGG